MQGRKAQNNKLLIRIVYWVLGSCISTYMHMLVYSSLFWNHKIVFLRLVFQVIALVLVIILLKQLIERSL